MVDPSRCFDNLRRIFVFAFFAIAFIIALAVPELVLELKVVVVVCVANDRLLFKSAVFFTGGY